MKHATILLAVVAMLVVPAAGADTSWQVAGPAAWNIGTNWDNGVPVEDVAYIENGGVCEINNGTLATSWGVFIGGAEGGELKILAGSTLTLQGEFIIGLNTAVGKMSKCIQTGGTVTAGWTEVGCDWPDGDSLLSISGGSHTTGRFDLSEYSEGTFEVVGGNSTITVDGNYTQYDNGGVLQAKVNASGLTTVGVTGIAAFDDTLTVLDDGAANDVYTLMTYTSKTGTFDTVNLPSADWSYNLGATSLTVTKVPEPATMSLLVMGGLALIRRRRK